MKLMHTTTTKLNLREFNKLSDKIIDKLYELHPEIQDVYDIHINYIEDSWQIDFIPLSDDIPLFKVSAHTEYDENDHEILKISPSDLTEFPKKLSFKTEDKSYNLCINYVSIFEFIIALYDFEYRL